MSFSNGNLYNLTTSGKKIKKERRADGNNKDERRKLGRRNGKGMRMFGNIMTGVMTWKLRRLNPLEEVRNYLKRPNRCSSLLRTIKVKVVATTPIKFEVDTEIKSFVRSNPGSLLIISFIGLLIFSATSLMRGNSTFANELATYGYYSLVGGVVLHIGSFLTKRPNKQNNELD